MSEQKWYSKENELNYTAPIFAKKNDRIEVLLPVCRQNSYDVIGYNWFNITLGRWGSCADWTTASQAVKNRLLDDCKIYNGKIIIDSL